MSDPQPPQQSISAYTVAQSIAAFEAAQNLPDIVRAQATDNARLRDALNGLIDFIEIDKLPMNRDALDIAYRAADRPKPR